MVSTSRSMHREVQIKHDSIFMTRKCDVKETRFFLSVKYAAAAGRGGASMIMISFWECPHQSQNQTYALALK